MEFQIEALLIFFVFTRSFSSIKSEETVHQSLRIFHPTSNIIKIIGEAGIPLDHISGKSGYYMDIVTTSDQTLVLEEKGIDLEILIQDMSKYFKERCFASLTTGIEMRVSSGAVFHSLIIGLTVSIWQLKTSELLFPLKFLLGPQDIMIPGTAFEGPMLLTGRVDADGDARVGAGDIEGFLKALSEVLKES